MIRKHHDCGTRILCPHNIPLSGSSSSLSSNLVFHHLRSISFLSSPPLSSSLLCQYSAGIVVSFTCRPLFLPLSSPHILRFASGTLAANLCLTNITITITATTSISVHPLFTVTHVDPRAICWPLLLLPISLQSTLMPPTPFHLLLRMFSLPSLLGPP